MAVRNTESCVPGGFSKASDLGQAVTSADNHYALVASLSQPLRNLKRRSEVEELTGEEEPGKARNNAKNWIVNTYVVFVDKHQVGEPSSYTWKLQFYTGESYELFFEDEKQTTDGVLELDTDDWDEVKCGDKLSRIKITVEMDGVVKRLPLEQDVVDSLDDIEALVATKCELAIAGTPQVTRLVANRYRNYLAGEEDSADADAVPAQLVTAVVFLNLLATSSSRALKDGLRIWSEYLNQGKESIQLRTTPLGIAQIRPPILSLFYPATAPPSLDPFIWDQSATSYYDNYAREITLRFTSLDHDRKIDLFNLLRFPKPAIRMCQLLLEGLRSRHTTWRDLSWDQVLVTKDAIHTIVSDYEKGPRAQFPEPTRFAERVFEIAFSRYVAGISGGSICELLRSDYVGIIPASDSKYEIQVLEDLEQAKSLTALLAINEGPDHARYDVNVTAELRGGGGTIAYLFYHYTHQGVSSFALYRINAFECEEVIGEDSIFEAISMLKAWVNMLKRATEQCPNATDHIELFGVADIMDEFNAWLTLMETWSTVISNALTPGVPMGATRSLTYDSDAFCPGFWDSEKALYDQEEVTPLRLQFKHDRPSDSTTFLGETPDTVLTTAEDLDNQFAEIRRILARATVKLCLVGRGYADKSFAGSTGGDDYNFRLSQRRADWVANRIPADIRKGLVSVSFAACGDRLAEPPDENPAYRDVRMLLVPAGGP